MIETTPFVNPFKKVEKLTGGFVAEEVVINGKVYKKLKKETVRVRLG